MLTIREECELIRLREFLRALQLTFWLAIVVAALMGMAAIVHAGKPRPLICLAVFETAVAAVTAAAWCRIARRRDQLEEML